MSNRQKDELKIFNEQIKNEFFQFYFYFERRIII